MDFILNTISAFLGGGIALLGQWYFLLREKVNNKRKLLFFLLEINNNLTRLKRLEKFDLVYDVLLKKLSEKMPHYDFDSIENIKPIFMNFINKTLLETVLADINEISKEYFISIGELSKEDAILAYNLSSHSKSLDSMFKNMNNLLLTLKPDLNEYDQNELETTIDLLFKRNILGDSLNEVKISINLLSKKISYLEYRKVQKFLKNQKPDNVLEWELDEFFDPFINSILNFSIK